MYTQTIYELSQEAERLLMLSLEHLKTVKKNANGHSGEHFIIKK